MRRHRIFDEIYADAAMDRQCPNCHVPPGDYCRRPDGVIRSVPCLIRISINQPERQPE